MLSSRDRVLQSLSFQHTDRTPKDLSGMRSTGISAFAYPMLIKALGLPPRLPRVYDTGQMLALPDLDVLDALGCDVVLIDEGITNAFPQPEEWHPYAFNGRLSALVRNPSAFVDKADGSIQQGISRMPDSSFVFDEEHGGQPVDFVGDLPRPDLEQFKRDLAARPLKDEDIIRIRNLCRQVRESSDRAIFLSEWPFHTSICIHGWGGMAVFPILCITEPDFVHELHTIASDYTVKNIQMILPEIAPFVDSLMMAADDWGTQNHPIASPNVYRELFLPYRRKINDTVHVIAPQVKTFLHSCGAIYNLLDLIIESNFDIVNPVQWPAGGHSAEEWKAKARGRITLWGGGVNSQATLPLGTVVDVENEVRQVVKILAQDGGYVFCNIHNILAEIPPDKVIAMYRSVSAEGYFR